MLKSGNTVDIQQMFIRLRTEARELLKSIIQLVWFMRGSIQYHSMLAMSYAERELVKDWIEEHLKSQKDNPNPNY